MAHPLLLLLCLVRVVRRGWRGCVHRTCMCLWFPLELHGLRSLLHGVLLLAPLRRRHGCKPACLPFPLLLDNYGMVLVEVIEKALVHPITNSPFILFSSSEVAWFERCIRHKQPHDNSPKTCPLT